MSSPYRVCIIGCGVIAPNHIKALLENEQTELVAVCDVIEERARSRAAESAGSSIAARMAMMAITTNSSINVKVERMGRVSS